MLIDFGRLLGWGWHGQPCPVAPEGTGASLSPRQVQAGRVHPSGAWCPSQEAPTTLRTKF